MSWQLYLGEQYLQQLWLITILAFSNNKVILTIFNNIYNKFLITKKILFFAFLGSFFPSTCLPHKGEAEKIIIKIIKTETRQRLHGGTTLVIT